MPLAGTARALRRFSRRPPPLDGLVRRSVLGYSAVHTRRVVRNATAMLFRNLTAQTIAAWEREVGASPFHGVEIGLAVGGKVEPHCHRRGQIMLVTSGVVTVSIPDRSWVLSPTCAVWVPEATPHHVFAPTMAELHNFQMSRSIAPHLPSVPCAISVSPLFRELVVSAVAGPNYFTEGGRERRILALMCDEFAPTPGMALFLPDPADNRLQRICSALRDDPSDNRTLGEWAETAGGCTRTLGRLFLKETGLTFAQWRRQLRILDAMVRLNRGQSVTSVALDTGYESTSAFIEMFRRVVGCTPGQFVDR
jgi:AraC-like DNA-binding protein/mannose-6-phosphate isomerase-like protein (cupin superfamily)